MTFYHFGNCLALAYAPFHMTYRYTGLADYAAFWKCVQAGFLYTFTQVGGETKLFETILLSQIP